MSRLGCAKTSSPQQQELSSSSCHGRGAQPQHEGMGDCGGGRSPPASPLNSRSCWGARPRQRARGWMLPGTWCCLEVLAGLSLCPSQDGVPGSPTLSSAPLVISVCGHPSARQGSSPGSILCSHGLGSGRGQNWHRARNHSFCLESSLWNHGQGKEAQRLRTWTKHAAFGAHDAVMLPLPGPS